MEWPATLIVALTTLIVTKLLDIPVRFFADRREFSKFRKQKVYEEIEILRDKVGVMYELASNWDSFEHKKHTYNVLFVDRDSLVGKYNKYPSIADAAREVVHLCTLVAAAEEQHVDVDKRKTELHAAHKKFIAECETFLRRL